TAGWVGAPASLSGRGAGVAGVGKVGHHLVEHLVEDGASVVVSDVNPAAVERVRTAFPDVEGGTVDGLPTSECDVYAPCALGASVDDGVAPRLQAKIVCGAANNQLAH